MGKIFARRTRKIKDKCEIEIVIVEGDCVINQAKVNVLVNY